LSRNPPFSLPLDWGIFPDWDCIGNGDGKMEFPKQEERMKKMTLVLTMIFVSALVSGAGMGVERQYVNVSFTLWQSKAEPEELARMINIPIPRLYRDSWHHDLVSLDVSDGKAHTKIFTKDKFRFVLTAEGENRLTLQVIEKNKEIFRFIHNRPSTADYIFYGSDHKTYMVELTYTKGNYPIGLLSPGIIKK
jgi:hypothetical protein